jgi:hypothetical protein
MTQHGTQFKRSINPKADLTTWIRGSRTFVKYPQERSGASAQLTGLSAHSIREHPHLRVQVCWLSAIERRRLAQSRRSQPGSAGEPK